jgi:hypothetical protein
MTDPQTFSPFYLPRLRSLLLVLCGASAQVPNKTWTPNYESLGPICSNHLSSSCGCENTQFRVGANANSPGKMFMMQSVNTHPCSRLFPSSTNTGACSYFRIVEMETGAVVANVSQSIDHDFCSAAVDHTRNTIWVFCSAFGRRNKKHPGPCSDGTYKGCYVGAWKASLNDLTSWSATAKSLTLPDGVGMANNDVTFVSGPKAIALAALPREAPAHQAVMIIEQDRGDRTGKIQFAVNTGTDGDLSKDWILLNGSQYHIDRLKPAAGEGTGDAPTIR